MTFGTFDVRVPALVPPDAVENANLAEGVAALDQGVGETVESVANGTFQHLKELLVVELFLNYRHCYPFILQVLLKALLIHFSICDNIYIIQIFTRL